MWFCNVNEIIELVFVCQHANLGTNLRNSDDLISFKVKRFLCFVLIDARCIRVPQQVCILQVENHWLRPGIVKITKLATVINFRLYLIYLEQLDTVLSSLMYRNDQAQEAETS
jgi:hypothetical protein